METYTKLLMHYLSRDKILRTVAYGSVFATGFVKGKLAQDLAIIAQQISNCRTINRLFDDIPTWQLTKTLGAGESDSINRIFSALGNIAIQLYFPFEKIAWLSDQKVLSLNSAPYWIGGIACWAIYLVFGILKGLRQIGINRYKIAKLIKQRKLESPDRSGDKDAEFKQKMYLLKYANMKQHITLLKDLGDITMAINWLPLGVLWSGKLSPSRNAFFGLISSSCGLYLSILAQREAAKK